MANHKLSSSVTSSLFDRATRLVARRLAHVELGFPLSVRQLQDAILPNKWRAVIHEMSADGVTMLRTGRFQIKFEHPSVPRSAVIQIVAPSSVILTAHALHPATLDNSILDNATLAALIKWTNTAVAERRLAKLVTQTVREFLNAYADCTGHVHARWPGLVMLADRLTDASAGQRYYVSQHKLNRDLSWKEKFHEKPRSLRRYDWDSITGRGWAQKNAKAMRISETILTSALVLPDPSTDNSSVHAHIHSWQSLPTDFDNYLVRL